MADAYKGDSPEKKLARLSFWESVREATGYRFFSQRHLVLASHEAGDVATLVGLGVDPSKIVAVDMSAERIEAARAKSPAGVRFIHGDVGEVAKSLGCCFASAFLDFCGLPGKRQLDAIAQVIDSCLPDGAVVGTAFQRGRESREMTADIVKARDVNRKANAKHRPATDLPEVVVKIHEQRIVEELFTIVESNVVEQSDDGRSAYVHGEIFDRLFSRHVGMCSVGKVRYVGHRVPMEIVARVIFRPGQFASDKLFHVAWTNWCKVIHQIMPAEVLIIPGHSDNASLALSVHGLENADAALNLPSGSSAAIKAHATRGSYGSLADRLRMQLGAVMVSPSRMITFESLGYAVADATSRNGEGKRVMVQLGPFESPHVHRWAAVATMVVGKEAA